MNSQALGEAGTLPRLPGAELQVTTEATTEADQRLAIRQLRGHHPPRAPMPTRTTPTRLPQFGRPGRKSSSTSIPGQRVGPVGRLFQTNRRSSIAQRWTLAWQLCHSSHRSPPGHVLRHLLDLLLHITTLIETMMIMSQGTSHANEEEPSPETIDEPSTGQKCRSIFTLKTQRLWMKESLCQDFRTATTFVECLPGSRPTKSCGQHGG